MLQEFLSFVFATSLLAGILASIPGLTDFHQLPYHRRGHRKSSISRL